MTGRSPIPLRQIPTVLPPAAAAIVCLLGFALLEAGMAPSPPGGSQALLAGQALLGAADKLGAGQIVAAYPPLALLPLVLLQKLTGLSGTGAASLLSAGLAGCLSGTWLRALLLAGMRPAASLAVVLLLVLSPPFLQAQAEGPEAMIALAAAWLLALSAFSMRGRGGVNDLMLCSASLLVLVFAGPAGALLALAALPFLPLVMPADIEARSWPGIYLMILFPALFALLGFALVNWLMLGDALAFLAGPAEAVHASAGGSWPQAAAAIVAAVATAPILLGLFILARDRRPIQAAAVALLGTAIVFALLAAGSGLVSSPAGALAPLVGLAAAAAMRWPAQQQREARGVLLLALGFMAAAFGTVPASRTGSDEHAEAEARLGRFLAGHSRVLVDAAAHPRIVAGRGSADGLITAGDTAFELSMLRRRIEASARSVAVAAPDASRDADDVGRNLPGFYAEGAPGFHLIYDRDGWRVWSRRPHGDKST